MTMIRGSNDTMTMHFDWEWDFRVSMQPPMITANHRQPIIISGDPYIAMPGYHGMPVISSAFGNAGTDNLKIFENQLDDDSLALHACIHCGRGLKKMNLIGGASDPYLSIHLPCLQQQTAQTTVVQENVNPKWRQQLELQSIQSLLNAEPFANLVGGGVHPSVGPYQHCWTRQPYWSNLPCAQGPDSHRQLHRPAPSPAVVRVVGCCR